MTLKEKALEAIKKSYTGEFSSHVPVVCSVAGCSYEASRWLPLGPLSGDFEVKQHTFFLCDAHREVLSPDDARYYYLNPETGIIRSVEVGAYACSEACSVCNE
jgi:hypothetical protein